MNGPPTPAEWLADFDRATPERRELVVTRLLEHAATASNCLVEGHEQEIADYRRHFAGLPAWRCPSCGATTRARMADHPVPSDGATLTAQAATVPDEGDPAGR